MRSRLIITLFLLIGLLFPMEYSSSGAQRQGTFPGGQFALRASLSGRIPAREGSLPLIDYGARMYDPTIARWMSVDPLAEKYYPMGGYGYCAGSPITLIDSEGSDWYSTINKDGETEYHYTEEYHNQTELNRAGIKGQYIGNHHFGVVAKSNILIPEQFALKQAGETQIMAGTSKPEWQRYEERTTWAGGYKTILKTPLPPYGDDPKDQYWISRGFDYYRTHFK
ncbi:MAG: hypothetical protein IJM60_03670 [Bacteroidales bacterium]|nr:hypothetical protein [Bacteroidales bacterium]